ncbi:MULTISPECIES: hypothetical protein [unclassified Clostridioides]|uniref:hypothetical protein n=1 Tax=unclassified Clostridioides TaxID=2635829 RepID=UPI001D1101F6|nr:hypothetical protein [Clostridioides sp. ES-S-0171-01]MCC0686943.1 hypothetical protein [Clostridioides sp. ES-S-0056-01]MCC0714231.1 hypothetical protein [Clostridioides sp. ES-S-0077-01]UDN55592.1 hypothetical protein JJC02_05290 [Clostridioides sp. ES-S-0054-01]
MGNTSRFYESVKNKYPKLKDGTRVHMWPKENLIIAPIYDEENGYKKSIGNVDSLSWKQIIVLTECDGKNTTEDIINILSNRYRNIPDVIDQIMEFFMFYENVYLTFEDEVQTLSSVFEITGNKVYLTPLYFTIEIDGNNNTSQYFSEITSLLKCMYEKGCRFIEIIGEDILKNKNMRKVFQYMLDHFDLIVVTRDCFTIDRSLIKELDNYRHKVIWKVYSKNDDTHVKLKEDIKITSLIKRGHTVVRGDREKAIKIEDMRFIDTKERFSKYGAEWSHLYISSDGSVKSYSLQKDKRIYLGNIFDHSVEEIFLEMQNKIDKREIVYQ